MSDNKIIRVGVLGACGNIGGTHTENLANYVNGAVLSRIYDIMKNAPGKLQKNTAPLPPPAQRI